ncbi:MAG: (d)CMP kinase [Gammaproteobacteria bacterium]|nr:(d)CMP kinase [Gammaproteobacteria bacterium]
MGLNHTGRSAVITIDGPSGVGKGTLALLLAKRLNWHLLDSGSLYRLVALTALRQQIPLDNAMALAELARHLEVSYEVTNSGVVALLAGEVVGDAIRTEAVATAASQIAALAKVREALLQRQRDFSQPPGLIADGRDMGTTVFPHAVAKLFLTASPVVRAERRYKQLKEKGIDANLRALEVEIAERDERDSQRSVSPLKAADDAVIIDTSLLTLDAVMQQAMVVIAASTTVSAAARD